MKKTTFVLSLPALALSITALTGCFLKGGGETALPGVVQVGVVSKGYGSEFAENLIAVYNKKEGREAAKLVYSGPNTAYQDQRLQLPNNQVDVIFAITS